MIHPSLIEKISLDERQANQAVIDDLKRSYPYVGPVTVARHAAADPACNVMRLIVRMGKPYWSSADASGDEMWDAVRTWLDAKLYKVGSTMANFNASRAEKGQQTVDYGRLELDMKPYLFSMALPTAGGLPEAEKLVGRFRELLNQGVFEGTVARVEMPSAASWAQQYAAAEKAAEERAAAEGGAAAAQEAAGPAGAVAVLDTAPVADAAGPDASGDTAALSSEASEAAPVADTEAPEAAGVSAETPAATPAEVRVVVEAVDYRLWDVIFEDGSVRALDSATGAWL